MFECHAWLTLRSISHVAMAMGEDGRGGFMCLMLQSCSNCKSREYKHNLFLNVVRRVQRTANDKIDFERQHTIKWNKKRKKQRNPSEFVLMLSFAVCPVPATEWNKQEGHWLCGWTHFCQCAGGAPVPFYDARLRCDAFCLPATVLWPLW